MSKNPSAPTQQSDTPPNIIFIMSDDHAANAISAYGSKINKTPNLDRIAQNGMRFDHCYCTNSICTPSRANILTGQHSHINGVKTLNDDIDGQRPVQIQKLLKAKNYQSAIIGKWHLGHTPNADPNGFDYWNVLPGQGEYHNPVMIDKDGEKKYEGYVTDIITDQSIDWMKQRDTTRPFMLMCHHKAPHRPWQPSAKYADLYSDMDISEPASETFFDNYATRSEAVREANMRLEHLRPLVDLKAEVPQGLSFKEERRWRYQRYIKDYLRCVASIDESVGRILDYLEQNNLSDNTMVVYTSDQGFYLGEHGWFDKRFMYEESFQMPFMVQYPKQIKAGSVNKDMLCNNDFAPTFMSFAGLEVHPEMQGVSAANVMRGNTPDDWQKSIYYRYWMHKDSSHNVYSHYGVCTHDYKLIFYYGKALGCKGAKDVDTKQEWELYDTKKDPMELNNVYSNPAYAEVVKTMKTELDRLQKLYKDKPEH